MNENKRYYWIKLKTDFFNQETIDFLLSQKNGCEYIVLYQMLCLNTANNNGKMCSKIGEMIIPYNVDKITRDTKYFDFDTVTIALGLFKQLGLIYEEEDKILKITNFDEMVGSESSSAKRVREYRERQKALQCNNNVTQEIEYRDKSIDIDINKKENYIKEKKFKKPTLEEVQKYCEERKNGIDAEKFVDYYDSIGWLVGKKPMKDWKACVRTWEKKEKEVKVSKPDISTPDWLNKKIEKKQDNLEELEDILNDFGG